MAQWIRMQKITDKANLSQKACLLEGLCISLYRTGGNFAVIIHSYKDCANVFPRGMTGVQSKTVGAGRFFCTNVTETDVMAGTSLEKLERCIGTVLEVVNPEIVYVFGSCLSEIVGDDINQCAAGFSRTSSIPVIAVTSSGTNTISQSRVIDWHAALMYCACDESLPVDGSSINIIGFPEDTDNYISGIIEASGIRINAWLHETSSLSEWKKLPAGAVNIVPQKNLFPSILEKMANRSEAIEAPVPIGMKNTDMFLTAIASAMGLEQKMPGIIAPARKNAEKAATELRRKCTGIRMGYNIGTNRNYVPASVALDGMSEVTAFSELGFDVTLLIQGSPDDRRRKLITGHLADLNINASIDIFVDNVSILPVLKKHGFGFIYCIESLSEIVRPSGTPMIGLGRLKMGYGGCIENIRLIERTVFGG